jgi:hypothetical protein
MSAYSVPGGVTADVVSGTRSLRSRGGQSTEGLVLALIALVVYGLASVCDVFHLQKYSGDALSRVANAYYVLFSHPHLGALGMVWNPLPSLLELPIVALHPWFPAVVTRGLAGSAITAVLGAIVVYHFHHIIKGFVAGGIRGGENISVDQAVVSDVLEAFGVDGGGADFSTR